MAPRRVSWSAGWKGRRLFGVEDASAPRTLCAALVLALVCLLALWPSLCSLEAGLVSDDGAVLGHLQGREGLLLDWTGPQYELHTVRFWRPLTTSSLALQERLSGVAPAPLRAFNIACHGLAALLLVLLARRLGASWPEAGLAGGLLALFPEQGGSVTWIVGRVDSLPAPLALGALLACLGGRAWLAGALCLLACAGKEIGFVVPVWAWLFAWGRGDSLREALRVARPVLIAGGLAFVWRWLALGDAVGGYAAGGGVPARPWAMASAFGEQLALPLLGSALALSAGAVLGGGRPRAALAAVVAAVVAALPLAHVLAPGHVAPEHARTLLFSDLCLCLAVGIGLGQGARRSPLRWSILLLAVAALGVPRARAARADVSEWVAAGQESEALVARAHSLLEGKEPSSHPVLASWFPRTLGGAYLFQWGVADRFRSPFPETPRPVWPLRPLFGMPASQRPYSSSPREELVWPFDPTLAVAAPIPVTVGGAVIDAPLVVDESLILEPGAADESPLLEVWGSFPQGTRMEFVIYTELGYEPGLWVDPGPGLEVSDGPLGPGQRSREISLRSALLASDSFALFEALVQAEDLGARVAYLELRVVDDARGVEHRPVAASAWIPLSLAPGLSELFYP